MSLCNVYTPEHNGKNLSIHFLLLVGEKPFKCHICDVRVTRQEHLKRHLLTHIEGRPFKCSACDFTARRKDGVRSHQRSKHQGVVVSIDTIIKIPGVMSGPDGKPVISGEYQEQSIVPGKLSTIPFGPKPNKGKKKKKKRDKNAPPPPPVAMIEGMPLPNADLAAITSMTAILAQQKEIYMQQQQQGQLPQLNGNVSGSNTSMPSSAPLYTTPMGTMCSAPMSNNTPMNTTMGQCPTINSPPPINSPIVNGPNSLQQQAMLNGLTHPGQPPTPQQSQTSHLTHQQQQKPLDMQVDKDVNRSPVMLEAAHKSMLNSMAHKLNRPVSKSSNNNMGNGGTSMASGSVLRVPKVEPCMSSPIAHMTQENKSPAAMFNPHMGLMGNGKMSRQLTTPMPTPAAPPIHTPLPAPSGSGNKPSAPLTASSPSCVVPENKSAISSMPMSTSMTADMERLLPQVMQASASFGQRGSSTSALPMEARPAHMNHSSATSSMMPPYYSNWPNLAASAAHHPQSSLIHAPNPIHPSGAGVMGQMINSLQEHIHSPQHPFSFPTMPHMSLHSKSHHS